MMKLLVLKPPHPDQPLRVFTEDGREFDGLVSARVDWGYEGFCAAFSQEIRSAMQLHPPVATGATIVLSCPEVVFITEPPQQSRGPKTGPFYTSGVYVRGPSRPTGSGFKETVFELPDERRARMTAESLNEIFVLFSGVELPEDPVSNMHRGCPYP